MKKLAVFLSLALCVCLCSCSLLPETEVRRVSPVRQTTESETFTYAYASVGDIERTTKISCTYVPVQKYTLSFGVAGESIDEIYVKAGDNVKKGDVLAQLKLESVDEKIRESEFEIEEIELSIKQLEENRQLELRRAEIQYSTDARAMEDAIKQINENYDARLVTLNDSLSVSRLRLETLTESREARRLYAPIDGTVTYVRKCSDEYLSSLTDTVITVADSTMSVFTAKTKYWSYLPVGTEVTITVSKVEYEAVVADETELGIAASEKVEGEDANVYFTLKNPAPELESNDRGSLTLLLDERRDVLRISESAVSSVGGEYIVYYETDEGVRSYKYVTLGLNAQGWYEVISGLTEGEAVITD